jgi:hypothetical protein
MIAAYSISIAIGKAQSTNRILRKLNSQLIQTKCLKALQKEFPSGDEEDGGVHLANSLAPSDVTEWQAWPPIARPNIGEYPPGDMFPKTAKDLELLDHARILQLIAFYNDPFAIRIEDDIELRREKFRFWCTE